MVDEGAMNRIVKLGRVGSDRYKMRQEGIRKDLYTSQTNASVGFLLFRGATWKSDPCPNNISRNEGSVTST